MLEISNFVLDLINITFQIMRKAKFIAVLSVSVMVTIIFWLVRTGTPFNIQESLMIIIPIVVVGFAIIIAFRRLKSVKLNLPAEDEMSKKILRKGAATSYYVSLYLWIALMFFEERIDMERSMLIGAGIVGMAIIYALSWIYHNFIRRSHD